MKRVLTGLVFLGCAGAIFAIALGFFGQLHPALDTFSHFRLHLSGGLLAGLPVLLVLAWNRLAILSALIAVFGIITCLNGTLLSATSQLANPQLPVHRMFHLNLFWINDRKQQVVDRVLEIDPVLISLAEASSGWEQTLKQFEDRWPHFVHCPEFALRGGIKIYSKFPLDQSRDFCGPYGSFMLTRVMLDDGSKIAIGSVHPRWPWPASGPRQYRSFNPALAELGPDALIAGDFNATPWSVAFNGFAEAGGLTPFPGIGGTWLADFLPAPVIRFIGLPIDHVLSKGRIEILSARSLENLGSDHLPILVEFQIDPPSRP